MSIGIAHIGPIVTSRKKKAKESKIAIGARSWIKSTGRRNASESVIERKTSRLRARTTSPVSSRTASLIKPPAVFFFFSEKNTPAEKNAEFFKFSLKLWRKKDGSQFR